MLLQCILIRKGGTTVQLPDESGKVITYHFKPKEGAEHEHLCEVTNEAHIHRLLSIPEAYRVYVPGGKTAKTVITKPAAAPAAVVEDGQQSGNVVDAIRDLSVRDLKATINRYSIDELRAALAAEQASSDPRKSWIEVVTAQIGNEP
jgi:hypothetical protein